MDTKLTGVELIAQERTEQLEKHGWTATHDYLYVNNELVNAAMQYLGGGDIDCWPDNWDRSWYKPNREGDDYMPNRIDELRIAGALIAAEIDRLLIKENGK